jgi:hypothetical protein
VLAFTTGLFGTVMSIGAGVLTVIQVALPAVGAALMQVGGVLAAFAVPVLIAIGAILGLTAVFRHGDFIISSSWEALQLLGNGFMWALHAMQEFQAGLWAGLLKFLSNIPGVGGAFKGMADQAAKEQAQFHQRRLDREKAMAANLNKIGDNTKKSLERTAADFKMIGDKVKGALPGKPPTTPKPTATGKPPAAPAATNPGRQPSVATPPPPAAAPPASLQPVTSAVTAGTTATRGVTTAVGAGTTATQGVRTAVGAGTTATQGVTTAVQTANKTAVQSATAQNQKLTAMVTGLNVLKTAMMAISSKVSTQATLAQVATNTAATNQLLSSGGVKVKFEMGNIGGKGGPGAVDQFTPAASSFGLQVTSGFRPGDPGYHGANRARDYSNSTGPTQQMMSFAQMLASSYGSSLSELIYTPLGFSIKNGQVVPPLASAAHYNHVHVAYGLGSGNPAFFNSANAADQWESKMARGNPIVSSVRARANEVGGGSMTVNAPITINQLPGQDSDELASIVAIKLTQAVNELRYSSYQV